MKSIQQFVLIASAAFGLAGCAGGGDNIMTPSATMPGGMDSLIGSSGSNGALTAVTIVAPRPLSQTPGLLSFNGLSLASPLAELEAPTPPSPNPNNFFAGMTDGMPHKLLLGSAPSPTPDDLCVYGSNEPHCDSIKQSAPSLTRFTDWRPARTHHLHFIRARLAAINHPPALDLT